MTADAGLNTRFLIGAENIVFWTQPLPLPRPRVQVQNRPCLLSKTWITRKNPVSILPWLDRVGAQNPPDRAAADRLVQSHLDPRSDIGQRLPTERSLGLGDLFTRYRFDDGMVQGGKNRPYGRGPRDRRPKSRRLPNVCASVELDPPTAPPVARPLRVPSGDTREAVKPAGSAERSDR